MSGMSQIIFVQHDLVLAERPCNQGWEIKEADEGEKEQSQENPWSQEGESI